MKKIAITVVLLIAVALGYCSLPLSSIATLMIRLTDQTGRKITSGAAVTFLDAAGTPIATVRTGDRGSWDNTLHWWTHSHHSTSAQRTSDALRATSARVTATGCDSATIPVLLVRRYEPIDFAPHGGGPAYYVHTFDSSVVLTCR